MAEQNLGVQEDPSAAPPPKEAPAGTNGTGQGDAEHEDTDDVEKLRAENAALKKSQGALLNEKSKWSKELAARKAEAERLKQYEELGIDLDEMRKVVSERAEAADKQAKDRGEIDKLLANRDAKHKKELEKKDEEVGGLIKQIAARDAIIDQLTIDAQLEDGLMKIGVAPELLKGAFMLHRNKAKGIPDEEARYGRRVAMMVGDDEMTVEKFLKQWAEADPEAQAYLVGNRSTGGGAPATSRGGKSYAGIKRSKLDAAAKAKLISEIGFERYNALPL